MSLDAAFAWTMVALLAAPIVGPLAWDALKSLRRLLP